MWESKVEGRPKKSKKKKKYATIPINENHFPVISVERAMDLRNTSCHHECKYDRLLCLTPWCASLSSPPCLSRTPSIASCAPLGNNLRE